MSSLLKNLFIGILFLIIILGVLAKIFNSNLDQKTIDLRNTINDQKLILNNLESSLSQTQRSYSDLTEIRNKLLDEVDLLRAERDGKTITYFIELELAQYHFTLDLDTLASDAINSIRMSIPVDREYYEKLEVGKDILDEFRGISALSKGSLRHWDIKVTRKWTSIS